MRVRERERKRERDRESESSIPAKQLATFGNTINSIHDKRNKAFHAHLDTYI